MFNRQECILCFAICLFIVVLSACSTRARKASQYYVSPNGNDEWSGTLPEPNQGRTDGPFQSIERARDVVRSVHSDEPITVYLRDGTHCLEQPLLFTARDSGTSDAPVTYTSYPGEKAIVSGGKVIGGWSKETDSEIWTTTISEVVSGKWYFHQLFVNGERRVRARTPNSGYFYIQGPLAKTQMSLNLDIRSAGDARFGFYYQDTDAPMWNQIQESENIEDVNVVLFHSWTATRHWVKNIDTSERSVRFVGPTAWPVAGWEQQQRYYIENCLSALDSPGEWYLNRKTGILYYWPLPGEDMTKAIVVAPRLTQLLRVVRGAGERDLVRHVHFANLSFQYADWFMPQRGNSQEALGMNTQSGIGLGTTQSGIGLGAAIVVDGARNLLFDSVEVAHVGEYGIWLRNVANTVVRGSHIHDLGGGGIRIGASNTPTGSHNVVNNCFIHDGGNVFHHGVGLWIGLSSHNTISHNEITDFYYTGISVGWRWGYVSPVSNNNTIEYNHIHHVMQNILSDGGGIYMLGGTQGSIISHNLVHDVYPYNPQLAGLGIYLDEGTTSIQVNNNIVYNIHNSAFHQHYGRENVIENNIFAFSNKDQLSCVRDEPHISMYFRHNIVISRNGQAWSERWNNGSRVIDYNLYWDISGRTPMFGTLRFETWQGAYDQHSLVADPMFVDIDNYDFRLQPDSPAKQIGFQPIDLEEVGLFGDSEWVDMPGKVYDKVLD